ncbi:MAG: ISKra4 family transposase, partial [Desulfobulbus sp.]|nr:ISKra4 family transposase [Desulfobulbus sp.]
MPLDIIVPFCIVHLFSWRQISGKAAFAQYLQLIKEQRLIPLDKVRLCFIGDGAGWIWDTVQSVFPDCRQALDYFHCAQYLHDFAQIRFGQNAQAREWAEQAKARLFHNNITGVLIGLNNLKCRTPEARQARAKLAGYLKGNKGRIEYGKLRRGGYPLGSGAIESANKFICRVRLKRSGAWWKID